MLVSPQVPHGGQVPAGNSWHHLSGIRLHPIRVNLCPSHSKKLSTARVMQELHHSPNGANAREYMITPVLVVGWICACRPILSQTRLVSPGNNA